MEITIDIQPPAGKDETPEAMEIVSTLEVELDRLGYCIFIKKNSWIIGRGRIDGFTISAEKK